MAGSRASRRRQHSGLGIVSFVIAVLIGVVCVGLYAAVDIHRQDSPVTWIFLVGGGTSTIGIVLGFSGLVQNNRKRTWPALGVLLNLAIVAWMVLLA